MNIFNVISLLGGLAMFLYGMRLMGDALKQNSSGTLKAAMGKVTDNPLKAFILGVLVTALIQSSTATIVITAGLVGAGILTLHQSLGIIIGANVGTTVTGQIIRLLDIDASGTSFLRFFQPSTLAPIALIIGIVLIMGSFFKNAKSIGNIAIGFGILFSGLLNMTGAVNTLTESGFVEKLFSGLGQSPVLGYITGAGVAFMLQSSSATIGILQAFSATGLLTFKAIYAVIVGVYLGDCVTTAIVIYIGAKAEPKRVAIMNILYNLSKSVLVLAGVIVAHKLGLLNSLWEKTVNSSIIANANTIFNLGCALALLPLSSSYEKLSRRIVKDVWGGRTPGWMLFPSVLPDQQETPCRGGAFVTGPEALRAALNDHLATGRAVTVTFTQEHYPTRDYGSFALPAGTYPSLRVIVGAGAGHNWWCVVFPPLCTADGVERQAVETMTENDVRLITSDEKDVVIKFRILEWYDAIKEALT